MSLPTRCMPVLMLDLNDRLGRPRAEEPHDLTGTVGAGVEGDSATRFRAFVRRHSIAVPQTFHLATQTFFGSSGQSRIDFVAILLLCNFRVFFQFHGWKTATVDSAAGPDLVTNGMRHSPDPTRGRWDHEKLEEILSDPVARLPFFKELETKFCNSSIVGLAATEATSRLPVGESVRGLVPQASLCSHDLCVSKTIGCQQL